jgi:hypothetical protein
MQKIMIFNPSTLEQLEVDDNTANKYVDTGWVKLGGSNRLVHMFHPGFNDNKNVLKADQKTWENKGYYAEPTIVYHPTEGKRQVSAEEAQRLYNQGWLDTVAKFPQATVTTGAKLIAEEKKSKKEAA